MNAITMPQDGRRISMFGVLHASYNGFMAFGLTLLYIALTVLSPGVLPQAILSLHVNEIVGGLAIFACIPSLPGSKVGNLPDTYLVIGLILSSMLSMIATGWLGGVVESTSLFVPVAIVFFFVAISVDTLQRLKVLIGVMALVGIFIFLQGLIAYYTGHLSSPYLEPQNVTDQETLYRFRGLGVLSDPNDFGQYLVTVIPLLWLRWKKGKFFLNFVFTLLPASALMAGIFYTHSRGAVMSIAVVLLFAFKERLGPVKAGILVAIAMVGILALNVSGGRGMTNDDGGRVAAWMTALGVWKTHPLVGVGMGNFKDFNDTGLTAHNSYVLCLAELGIIGYIFWMGLIVSNWNKLTMMIKLGKRTLSQSADKIGAKFQPQKAVGAADGGWSQQNTSDVPARSLAFHQLRHAGAVPAGPGILTAGSPPRHLVSLSTQRGGGVVADDAEVRFSAHVIRTAMVGTLATAFFLSRTYSVTLYLVLGMATALWNLNQPHHPELMIPLPQLSKRILITVVVSIVGFYVFLRAIGLH